MTAKCDFAAIPLNNDESVNIIKGAKIKVLSSDCSDHLFGYLVNNRVPMIIPCSKVMSNVAACPKSSPRTYEIDNWADLGLPTQNNGVMSIEQIMLEASISIKQKSKSTKTCLDSLNKLNKGDK